MEQMDSEDGDGGDEGMPQPVQPRLRGQFPVEDE